MPGEGYSDWVQRPDVTVVVSPEASLQHSVAHGSIHDGRAAVDTFRGFFAWKRSLGDPMSPQEYIEAFAEGWKAARRGFWPLSGQSYYYNGVGPYDAGNDWTLGAPEPPWWGPTSQKNRDNSNRAENAVSYRFQGSTGLGGQARLEIEVRMAVMAYAHQDFVQAAGPLGTCEPAPLDPMTYFADEFAAEADGRPWEVEYESVDSEVLGVEARPDAVADDDLFNMGGGDVLYKFTPLYAGARSFWGPFHDSGLGVAFATGDTPDAYLSDDDALLLGVQPTGVLDPAVGFTALDVATARAQEALHGHKGYLFFAYPQVLAESAAPEGPPGGDEFLLQSYARRPMMQFKLNVRPVRYRAHYLASYDPSLDPPDPQASSDMGRPRQSFLRGR